MIKILFLAAMLGSGMLSATAAEDHAALELRMREQLVRQPGNLEARFQLARALGWQTRYDEALAEYSRLLKARPDNVDFLLGLAQVHIWRGEPKQSLPFLQQARRLAPHYEEVWRTQIKALLELGYEEGIRQARLVRDIARSRFPRSDWFYARLDAAPVVAASAMSAPPVSATPAPAQSSRGSDSPAAALIPAAPVVPAVAATSVAPVATAPAALERAADSSQWEAGMSHESLTRGLSAWRSRYVLGEWKLPNRRTVYAGLRDTVRYALKDREAHLGGVLPLRPDTLIQLEAGFSDSHQVLPARYGMVEVQHQPFPGWGLGAGWRRSVYDAGLSRVAHVGVDRYLGNERFGYTLYLGGPDGSGLSSSHRLQWAHSYGERDWLGLTLTRGRETENAGTAGFLTAQVSAVSLSGRHSFAPDWGLVWEAGSQRQGDLYSRSGVRIGLRHSF